MNAVTVIQIKIYFNFMIIEGYVIDNSLIKALTQIEQWQNGNAVITIYQDRIDKCSFGKRIQLGEIVWDIICIRNYWAMQNSKCGFGIYTKIPITNMS